MRVDRDPEPDPLLEFPRWLVWKLWRESERRREPRAVQRMYLALMHPNISESYRRELVRRGLEA